MNERLPLFVHAQTARWSSIKRRGFSGAEQLKTLAVGSPAKASKGQAVKGLSGTLDACQRDEQHWVQAQS
eukprot:1144555-Pelagomonas_calceolata.AAC.12